MTPCCVAHRGRGALRVQHLLRAAVPVPVSVVQEILDDAFLFGRVPRRRRRHVLSGFGRHVPEAVKDALRIRADFTCSVQGCTRRARLEIDHTEPFAAGGPTRMTNTEPKCDHHHQQKTNQDRQNRRHRPTRPGRQGSQSRGSAPPHPYPRYVSLRRNHREAHELRIARSRPALDQGDSRRVAGLVTGHRPRRRRAGARRSSRTAAGAACRCHVAPRSQDRGGRSGDAEALGRLAAEAGGARFGVGVEARDDLRAEQLDRLLHHLVGVGAAGRAHDQLVDADGVPLLEDLGALVGRAHDATCPSGRRPPAARASGPGSPRATRGCPAASGTCRGT